MDIKPIDLPSAAGLSFGAGDCRHFSESDAVNVPGLQNPTRHLAERDNILASKVNELVAATNNKEQYVTLPIPRTVLAPGTEEVVTNFKIPDGFEARILNSAVGSTPASAAATLKICYSTGYGNLAGTELMSTASTFTAGLSFYNSGEFIVSLRNNGASTLEIVASVTLTVRPIGSTASLLVGSVIRGERGFVGSKGDKGEKGATGGAGTGVPGLIWKGAFSASTAYSQFDAVSLTANGITQSYIGRISNPAAPPSVYSVSPPNGTYWDLLASAGSAGSAGAGLVWKGEWSRALNYLVNDAVSSTVGGVTSSYICKVAVNSNPTRPEADSGNWDLFSGPGNGETPTYATTADVLFTYRASPDQPSGWDIYGAYGANEAEVKFTAGSFREFRVQNTVGSPRGLVMLYGQVHLNMPSTGNIALILPNSTLATGAWTTSEVTLNAVAQGTHQVDGVITKGIDVSRISSGTYTVTNLATTTQRVSLSAFGVKVVS